MRQLRLKTTGISSWCLVVRDKVGMTSASLEATTVGSAQEMPDVRNGRYKEEVTQVPARRLLGR